MMLSGLEQLQSQSVELEQYITNGNLAARWLMDIAVFGDLTEGCTAADLGAGNGVLGLGLWLWGLDGLYLLRSTKQDATP